MESGKPIIIPDIDHYAPEMRTILVRRDIQSFFVYPIVRKNGRPIGFITISKLTPYSPSDGEITAYTLLAERTGAALENLGLYKNLRDLSIAISRSLANAIDARDPYTRGHSEEVARLAVQLGRKLDLDSVELEMLEFAALLHDIGKIAVPDTILQKTGRLSPSDWDILHMHPYYSAQIIRPIGSMERIVPWIYHHHERWDGRGYPDGLAGENIPLPARIIALADSYNAMMTDRPYRKRLGREETILEIESNAGIQFDPLITKKFLKLIMK
jgi:putative nucleotidyltransferase with HDIG domain